MGMLDLWCKANLWLGQVTTSPTPLPGGAPALPEMPPMEVTNVLGPQFFWYHYLLLFIQVVVAAGLVACVLSQTTKNEGLGGTIMGPSQSVFRGKKSSEEKLSSLTTWLAVSFIVLSLLVSYVFSRI